MAESSLSLTYDDLRNAVSHYLGWGRNYTARADSTVYSLGQRVRPATQNGYVYECTTAGTSHSAAPTWLTVPDEPTSEEGGTVVWTNRGWVADHTIEIDEILKIGLRQFYFPPLLPGQTIPHRWRFLDPDTTFTVWPTTTAEAVIHTTTLTTATAKFYPSMVGQTVVFDDSGNEYTISAYTSSTSITLATAATTEADHSFTITPNGLYRLPDDFGAMRGNLTYPQGDGLGPCRITSDVRIREAMQSTDATGPPTMAAIVPIAVAASTTVGQRFDLRMYPIPDDDYVLTLSYSVLPDALTSTRQYPYGGTEHAETIRASCLAAAEHHKEDVHGDKWQYFLERLAASLSLDITATTPDTLGVMGQQYVSTVRNWGVTYTSGATGTVYGGA